MNYINKIIYKLVGILGLILGIQFDDYMERKKSSIWKKIYTVIIFVIFFAFTVNYTIQNVSFSTISCMKFILDILFIEENSIGVISILTEIFIIFPKQNYVSEKINFIDKHMEIDKTTKFKFTSQITNLYFCFFMFTVITNYLELATWGLNVIFVYSAWKSKILEFILFKFVMIAHQHLCRLRLMNDYLKIKLNSNSKRDIGKCNWLLDWKLYPQHIKVYYHIEDFNIFTSIYINLCENMSFISKRFEFLVSMYTYNK